MRAKLLLSMSGGTPQPGGAPENWQGKPCRRKVWAELQSKSHVKFTQTTLVPVCLSAAAQPWNTSVANSCIKVAALRGRNPEIFSCKSERFIRRRTLSERRIDSVTSNLSQTTQASTSASCVDEAVPPQWAQWKYFYEALHEARNPAALISESCCKQNYCKATEPDRFSQLITENIYSANWSHQAGQYWCIYQPDALDQQPELSLNNQL